MISLRKELPLWQVALLGVACIGLCYAAWSYTTRGESDEERIISSVVLPSPAETFDYFYPQLWVDSELTRNTWATLKRVGLGFGLAALLGVPLGILCGCFPAVNAFFLPLQIFGRNIPIAALIGLLVFFFTGETQKVMFIFIACVAFIVSDSARAIAEVGSQYVDTAFTLGANLPQVILKVLVPLAMPSVFNSMRLLFGLAFGYIMLAEFSSSGSGQKGLGGIINVSQHRGLKEPILLILLIIPLVAVAIDRFLFWVQRELFPHRYGGVGLLSQCVRATLHGWEDVKALVVKPAPLEPFALSGAPNSEKS